MNSDSPLRRGRHGKPGLLLRQIATGYVPCLAAIVVLCGCGSADEPERLEVAGSVTVNGDPLAEGRIAFLPQGETPGPAVGGEIRQGRFVIPLEKGPAAGTHRVEILAMRSTGEKTTAGSGAEDPEALGDVEEQFSPEPYNRQSQLTVEVTPSTAGSISLELEIPE